ncbi:MAG: ABC transporter permease [Deltaproteobacteria bacterium]|nr:ABC transporter permease [Deltaproteobacteria bacterium]
MNRNLATIVVLFRRELVRFFRQRSRVLGALAQPIIFWVIIGGGLDRSFLVPGAEGLGYREYFFPGVLMMVVLFTSIFSTMSIIEDRHAGFLQAVLVAPSSRSALVLGKALGGVSIALLQALLLLLAAPVAGFSLGQINLPHVLLVLVSSSLALTALGFAIAWWLDSVQGFHAIMSVLLIPAWILSGAMFPVEKTSKWMGALMHVNPITYGVEGLRRALYGGVLPPGVGVSGSSMLLELGVVAGFAVSTLALAAWTCKRQA